MPLNADSLRQLNDQTARDTIAARMPANSSALHALMSAFLTAKRDPGGDLPACGDVGSPNALGAAAYFFSAPMVTPWKGSGTPLRRHNVHVP